MVPPSGATLLIASDRACESLTNNDGSVQLLPGVWKQTLGQPALLVARLLGLSWPRHAHTHSDTQGSESRRKRPSVTTSDR